MQKAGTSLDVPAFLFVVMILPIFFGFHFVPQLLDPAAGEEFVEKITKRFGQDLTGITFAVWGLAFKPKTDDMREAPAITIINALLEKGAKVKAFDPKAIESAKFHFADRITYSKNAYDEINTAIHPALFQLIVSLFNNNKSNPNNAQLLFTTHDISIASDGNLRADQVWFAEKVDGASQLYSAQDFDDINITVPFDRWYKSGRFGALPKFGNVDYIFEGNGTREKDNQ